MAHDNATKEIKVAENVGRTSVWPVTLFLLIAAGLQKPTLTCGVCRNPLIRLTFREIIHHQ